MISVGLFDKSFKIRILKGPNWDNERKKIKTVPGKKPIYWIDPATAKSTFKWWEVPRSEIDKLCDSFPRGTITFEDDETEKIFEQYYTDKIPLDHLPPIEKEINWIRPPLYPPQEDYVRIAAKKTKLICAADPGMGKSWMTLVRADLLGYKQLLIISPSTIMTNWWAEVFKNLAKDCLLYQGTIKQRAKLAAAIIDAPIVVSSYTMTHELLSMKPDQIIFDEAHMLAHETTLTFDRAKRLIKKNPQAHIQMATGTPILHKPLDLWAPVHLIYPELAGDKKAWEDRYQEVEKYFQKKIYYKTKDGEYVLDDYGNPRFWVKLAPWIKRTRNLDELNERIKPFLFRAKRDFSFGESTEIMTVRMTERQKKLYKQIAQGIILNLESGQLEIKNALSELTRLLQVAEGSFNIEPKWTDSGKVEFCKEYAKIYPDEKIIFWSRFKKITEILYEHFKDEAVIFNGDRTKNQKDLAIYSFQGIENDREKARFDEIKPKGYKFEPGEARLFFGTIDKVSSLGFNLHACHRQVFTSYTWNGNINKQAADRVMRSAQEADQVYTTFLASKDTIEFEALQMIFNNLKNCQHILDGKEDVSVKQTEELIKILRRQIA